MTDTATYSEARASATKYTIYPRGYDQAPFSDAYNFCVYVEQYHDTGRWRVHYGSDWMLSTHKGKWVQPSNLNRQWTRFDTAEAAIEVALVAVENLPGHRNLIQQSEAFLARRALTPEGVS